MAQGGRSCPPCFVLTTRGGRKGGASCANGPFLSVGAAAFGGPRRSPARLPPFRGKLSAARLTDEGADGGNGRSFPPPPHPSFAPQMPPSPLWGEGFAGGHVGTPLRRRKLHTPQGGLSWPFGPIHLLVRFRLAAKARSFRCSSSPHATRFAGLARGPHIFGRFLP